jgi:hypothetical protein
MGAEGQMQSDPAMRFGTIRRATTSCRSSENQ